MQIFVEKFTCNRIFRPKPYSGRSANFVLHGWRKNIVALGGHGTHASCVVVRDYTDWANSPFACKSVSFRSLYGHTLEFN